LLDDIITKTFEILRKKHDKALKNGSLAIQRAQFTEAQIPRLINHTQFTGHDSPRIIDLEKKYTIDI
jgi:hypothetical protein